MMWQCTSFITTGATGRRSLRLLMLVLLGSQTITADFRHGERNDWDSEAFKVLVKTSVSWSAHSQRTFLVTPSGPAASWGSPPSAHLTLCPCALRLGFITVKCKHSGSVKVLFIRPSLHVIHQTGSEYCSLGPVWFCKTELSDSVCARFWAMMFGGVSERIQRDRARAGGLGSVQQAVRYLNQDFQALKEECLLNRTLFQDPVFPAEPASLGFKELGPKSSKTRGVDWKRPTVRTRTRPTPKNTSNTF